MANMHDSAFLTAEKSMMGHYKQQNFKLQWNPVNTVPMGQKKLTVLTGDRINEGFLQENVGTFCLAAKNSGRNNEVAGGSTVLIYKKYFAQK